MTHVGKALCNLFS